MKNKDKDEKDLFVVGFDRQAGREEGFICQKKNERKGGRDDGLVMGS